MIQNESCQGTRLYSVPRVNVVSCVKVVGRFLCETWKIMFCLYMVGWFLFQNGKSSSVLHMYQDGTLCRVVGVLCQDGRFYSVSSVKVGFFCVNREGCVLYQ